MANMCYVTIKSDKVDQYLAKDIFDQIVAEGLVRSFSFHDGYISYCTRGLADITSTLVDYDITNEEIDVKDEFDLLYESFTPEELESMKAEANQPLSFKEFSF